MQNSSTRQAGDLDFRNGPPPLLRFNAPLRGGSIQSTLRGGGAL
ncbi:hypothetical protein [Methylobacterium sp. WL103]|nr:hypothetical protein [Methylobacterium sp. WL103]